MKKNLLILFVFVMQIVNAQTPIQEFNFNGSLTNTTNTTTLTVQNNSSAVYLQDRFGNSNSACQLNSTKILTGNLTNLPTGNASRSISVWVNYAFVENVNYFFGYGTQAANQAFCLAQYKTISGQPAYENAIEVQGFGPAANNIKVTASQANTAVWYHYVITTDGSQTKFYRNGVLLGTIAKTWNTVGTNVTIGKVINGGYDDLVRLEGAIDDLNIYDFALTDAQVSNLYAPATLPVISNTSATAVTTNSATINYSINSFGQDAERRVRYEFGITSPILTTPIAFNSATATPYTTNLTGLSQNRRYVAKVFAQVVGQADFEASPNMIFTTTGNLPVPIVSGVNVFNISSTSASLNYLFNPNGNSPSTANIQYATGNTLTAINGAFEVTGTSNVNYTSNLTGLTPNTTYSYIIFGSNAFGESQDITGTFTTLPSTPAPAVTNVSTSNVTFNSATVNFNLNAFSSATTYVVEYTTDVLAPWQTQNGGTSSVNTSTPFQVQLTGLTPDETYFVRVRATNATSQVTISPEIQFNTLPAIILTNVNDSNITATTAQINYTLNTNGFNTFIEVRYQASTVFDSDNPFTTVVISNFTVNNTSATNYSFVLTGLLPNTTYSYQFGAVTQSFGGVETGENAAFTTLGVSAQPTAPSPQTFCQFDGATIASLSATGTNIKWYANATGGSPLAATTPLVEQLYYVTQTLPNSAESTRRAVQVIVNFTSPPSNVPANQVFCQTATLGNIQTGAGSNFKWYAAQTGGVVLPNSTAISSGTYYLSQTIGCESPRIAVSVTVNLVNAPTAQAQTFCQSGTVANLTANGTQLQWYTAQTGGTQLATTTALTTGTYYVSQTNANCESSRTAVSVTVNIVNAPTASAQTFCQSATVANLTANGTNLKWYTTATGGSPLSNVASLSTATYYVSQTVNACESSRTPVSVTVNQIGQPVAQSNQSFCSGATLSDVQFVLGGNLTWYTSATGGSILPSSTVMTSSTYYVTRTVASCESLRTAVSVTVNVVAAPTGNASQSFTQGATVANLVANGTSVVWFASQADASANVNPLALTTLLVNNTTYYAMQTVNNCRSNVPLAVTVSITLGLEEAAPQFNFVMYPNPAKDTFTIDTENEIESVEIYSLHGQKVIATTSSEINVSTLPNGIYFVKVQDQNGAVATQKLVIR